MSSRLTGREDGFLSLTSTEEALTFKTKHRASQTPAVWVQPRNAGSLCRQTLFICENSEASIVTCHTLLCHFL